MFFYLQNSANQYNDPSVFADLSSSHKSQLDLMLKHFTKAMTIRKKFQNSKRELTFSLLARLKTIMICETELNSLNCRVVLYAESLKKLKRSLEVVEQLNLAPKIYFTVFKEINRRNKFNFFFKIWSSFIVQMNSKLVHEENKRREEFRKLISNHFLKSFFPKFTDNVPEFACKLPPDYDNDSLPVINEDEFCEFIKANSKFDETNSIEQEDNLLNGLVYRFNNSNKSINADDEMMVDSEKLSLANFLDSFFFAEEERQSSLDREIENVKHQMRKEYESKLNELKLEYESKLNEKLIELKGKSDNDQANQRSQLDKRVSNYRITIFKNLVNELSNFKYTDYLKNNANNDANHQTDLIRGPNFISFVSSLFSIIWPKNHIF